MNESVRNGLLPLLARLLIVAEFVIAVMGKMTDWSGQTAYMSAHGLPFIAPLLGAALLAEFVGSLCLIAGLWARSVSRSRLL
jgi:uncharacterized membrane protein YphA (DoxX/SURF4 family)